MEDAGFTEILKMSSEPLNYIQASAYRQKHKSGFTIKNYVVSYICVVILLYFVCLIIYIYVISQKYLLNVATWQRGVTEWHIPLKCYI